jgi:ABC-type sugar transport system substrate-binding protein
MEHFAHEIGRRALLRGFALTGAAVALAACNTAPATGGQQGSQSAQSSGGAQQSQAAPTNDFAKTEGMKVGAVLETLSHPLIKVWGDYLANEGKGFGMDVSVQDGERNVQKQTSQMEAFITQKVNFIVLQATDAAGLSPVVKKAEEASIPVITLNQNVAQAHTGFVGMGHYGMGVQVAEGIAKQLGGKGNIVLLEGVEGTGANIERVAGFKDTLKKYPDLKIVADQSAAFDRKKGHDVFETILKGQPKIDAVFGVNDEMALGAAQAAIEAGRRQEMKFWGADGELDMLKGIKDGTVDGVSAIDVLLIPRTVMYLGAWLMTARIKGNQFAGKIEIPPYAVTAENIDKVPFPPA